MWMRSSWAPALLWTASLTSSPSRFHPKIDPSSSMTRVRLWEHHHLYRHPHPHPHHHHRSSNTGRWFYSLSHWMCLCAASTARASSKPEGFQRYHHHADSEVGSRPRQSPELQDQLQTCCWRRTSLSKFTAVFISVFKITPGKIFRRRYSGVVSVWTNSSSAEIPGDIDQVNMK